MKFHQVECHSLLRHAGGNTRVDMRDSKKQKQYIFHLNGSLMEIASIKKTPQLPPCYIGYTLTVS